MASQCNPPSTSLMIDLRDVLKFLMGCNFFRKSDSVNRYSFIILEVISILHEIVFSLSTFICI